MLIQRTTTLTDRVMATYREGLKVVWEPQWREARDVLARAALKPEARFVVPVDGNRHTLRWVMAHMTSETARHAGHADILREQLDGTTGR